MRCLRWCRGDADGNVDRARPADSDHTEASGDCKESRDNFNGTQKQTHKWRLSRFGRSGVFRQVFCGKRPLSVQDYVKHFSAGTSTLVN